MPALIEAHAEHGIAELDKSRVRPEVRVGTRVGLNVGESGAVELAGAFAGDVLDDVDLLAAAVVALAGIALGVFVGKHAADRLHNRRRSEVLRCDQLHAAALACQLLRYGIGNLWIFL